MLLVHGPHFEKHWSRVDLLGLFGKSPHKQVSALWHFWISFQGEPKPPLSLGGPSSLCHCQKAQANPSSGCPSLPDTTWGCGSGQELQQEADQREHTGDERGCGQRAPKEYPSQGSFFVQLRTDTASLSPLLVPIQLESPPVPRGRLAPCGERLMQFFLPSRCLTLNWLQKTWKQSMASTAIWDIMSYYCKWLADISQFSVAGRSTGN